MHETKIRVQYYETDRMGVVHHSNYIRYFETGRTEFIRSRGISYADIEAGGVLMPIISAECRYFHPACYDELLTIRTKISEEITARICFAYEIYNESAQLVCTGSTALAFVDAATRRPVRPPEAVARLLRGTANGAIAYLSTKQAPANS
ncbi:MAG: acyl-CoA thioesterase [Prevotellaceae bacterium]|jgi:acyl-CoA thioester hydrolase|nr:acyl-CoA thioesterase [Prevotellaceae bacterium]